jgi:hypothetical protein
LCFPSKSACPKVALLLHYGVKPLLVFDGAPLPAKAVRKTCGDLRKRGLARFFPADGRRRALLLCGIVLGRLKRWCGASAARRPRRRRCSVCARVARTRRGNTLQNP